MLVWIVVPKSGAEAPLQDNAAQRCRLMEFSIHDQQFADAYVQFVTDLKS